MFRNKFFTIRERETFEGPGQNEGKKQPGRNPTTTTKEVHNKAQGQFFVSLGNGSHGENFDRHENHHL